MEGKDWSSIELLSEPTKSWGWEACVGWLAKSLSELIIWLEPEQIETAISEASRVGSFLVLVPRKWSVKTRILWCHHLGNWTDPCMKWWGREVGHWHSGLVPAHGGSVFHAQEPPVRHGLQHHISSSELHNYTKLDRRIPILGINQIFLFQRKMAWWHHKEVTIMLFELMMTQSTYHRNVESNVLLMYNKINLYCHIVTKTVVINDQSLGKIMPRIIGNSRTGHWAGVHRNIVKPVQLMGKVSYN